MAIPSNNGINYWLHWQVPVCSLIIIVPVIVAIILIYKSKRICLNSNVLWIPCWKNLNPVWVLIYRAVVFLIMSSLLIRDIIRNGAWTFYFYTELTFTLVTIYFGLGTILSAHGCWMYLKTHTIKNKEGEGFLGKDLNESESTTVITVSSNEITNITQLQIHRDQNESEERAGFWGRLMQIIYQICAGAVVLTDIVFWFILVPFLNGKNFRVDLFTGFMHSLNFVFLLLDSTLNSLPFPWIGFNYFIVWTCIYTMCQWVLHACSFKGWPYAFLELSTPWAPLWYFALAFILVPCFGIYALILKGKNWAFSRLFPNSYVKSR